MNSMHKYTKRPSKWSILFLTISLFFSYISEINAHLPCSSMDEKLISQECFMHSKPLSGTVIYSKCADQSECTCTCQSGPFCITNIHSNAIRSNRFHSQKFLNIILTDKTKWQSMPDFSAPDGKIDSPLPYFNPILPHLQTVIIRI
jgi:hypothetical protein